jgi:hypothetical protein
MKDITLDLNNMTIEQFMALPHRRWNEDIGEFDSLIIIPIPLNYFNILCYQVNRILYKLFPKIVRKQGILDIEGLHDSGYRCMDFVAVKDGKVICLLSGCSDVIHLEGIGGYGKNWLNKYGKCPLSIPPSDWSIDCLAKSGLLRIWSSSEKMTCGTGLSSFEIYTAEKSAKEK